MIRKLDAYRGSLGRPTLSALDAAKSYSPRLHMAGEHASLLTFGYSAADSAQVDRSRFEPVAVIGNSLGWYSALYVSGALELGEAARLVETLGSYQAGNVQGAQFIYPLVDEEWKPLPELAQSVDKALVLPGIYLSIRLGGSVVLGCEEAAIDSLKKALPAFERSGRSFPLQLPLHSAFHTPIMASTADRAQRELADLDVRQPLLSLVAGDARVRRPWSSPAELLQYTVGPQQVEPFDFTSCVTTAAGEFGPELFVVLGPGDTLGAPIAQSLIAARWRGLRDRKDFLEAQASDAPLVMSMGRADQRAQVIAA